MRLTNCPLRLSASKWSRPLASGQRSELLRNLNLPQPTGPAKFWLTKFEDHWPYGKASGDLYFSKSADQKKISSYRQTPFDPTLIVVGVALVIVRLQKRSPGCQK